MAEVSKGIDIHLLRDYEKQFSANKYEGRIKSASAYEYKKGSIPVIVSAPHSVHHVREGRTKCADILTGAIAKLLYHHTDCHILYRTRNDGFDPNYNDADSDGGYKKELLRIIEREKINVLIDIHGAAEDRDFDIDIGTYHGHTLNGFDFIPEALKIIFNSSQINEIGHNRLFTAPKNTVANYISSNIDIPCMQLEINRSYRDINNEDNLQKIITSLICIINLFRDIKWDREIFIFKAEKSKTHIPIDKAEFSRNDARKIGLEINDTIFIEPLICGGKNRESAITRYREAQNSADLQDGCIYLTNTLYSDIFNSFSKNDAESYVIVYKSNSIMASIGIPRAGAKKIVAGSELFKKIDPRKKYQLYNRIHDIDFYVDEIGQATKTTAPNALFLDHYQRQLMNINLPVKVIPEEFFCRLINGNTLTDEEVKVFTDAYRKTSKKYELNEEYITDDKLISISKKLKLDKIELIEIERKEVGKKRLLSGIDLRKAVQCILKKVIRTKVLMLKVGRPYITDESSDVVRLTHNVMNILGISETDKVRVRYRGKEAVLRAMAFDSTELMKLSNDSVYDDIDANLIIGIPNQHRVKLGIYSLNSIVSVERDAVYLFIKNSNNQILPILGVIFTILQTFSGTWLRLLMIIIFVPVAIFISLSQERAKIDKQEHVR